MLMFYLQLLSKHDVTATLGWQDSNIAFLKTVNNNSLNMHKIYCKNHLILLHAV